MRSDGQGSVYHLISREDKLKQGKSEDVILTCVDDILYKALQLQASDIHIQPHENTVVVRYRIDGVLYDQQIFDSSQALLIISRFKVLSLLDIAQRRIPQDGHFKVIVDYSEYPIDFRVATLPTVYGEKIVIRILDRALRLLTLHSLGMNELMYANLISLIQKPHGLFLVTGPTGSGKTTMLYALISAMNAHTHNIVTIEDPIEYELSGITQSQVNELSGFTFHNGLRSLLRQDPDIIMIGEIRDKQTAQIAIESALTGHLVLSTLHTNDASSAVTRLLEMGVEPFLLSATMVGVLAQRLVRKLCDLCKKEVVTSSTIQNKAMIYSLDIQKNFEPRGCRSCNKLGYKGRIGIFELLLINDVLRKAILEKSDAVQIRKQAMTGSMRPLLCDGFDKIRQGITSYQEVERFITEQNN